MCPCSGNEIDGHRRRRRRAGHIECQQFGRDLQRRAAAERRHNGDAAARGFGSRRVHGTNQQARNDAGREQATHIAGEEDRTWRRGDLLGLERPLSLRLLLTTHAFARQKQRLWRAARTKRSERVITVPVSEASFRCAKIEPLRVRAAPDNPPE